MTLLNSQKLIGDGPSGDLATVAGITLPPYRNSLAGRSGTKPDVGGSVDVITARRGV